MIKHLVILLSVLLSFNLYSQDISHSISGSQGQEFTLDQAKNAISLSDIKTGYPSSWISAEDYQNTEIVLFQDNQQFAANGDNDILNADQKALLSKATLGSTIVVNVNYSKLNDITRENQSYTMSFALSVTPDLHAQYEGSTSSYEEYINQKIIHQMDQEDISQVLKTPIEVIFTVNDLGKVENVRFDIESDNPRLNKIIVDEISNMPKWKPASMNDGSTVAQDFYFTIGNVGC